MDTYLIGFLLLSGVTYVAHLVANRYKQWRSRRQQWKSWEEFQALRRKANEARLTRESNGQPATF